MLFAGLGSVRVVKNCDLGQPQFFLLYRSPIRQITYLFVNSTGFIIFFFAFLHIHVATIARPRNLFQN